MADPGPQPLAPAEREAIAAFERIAAAAVSAARALVKEG